MRAICSTLHAAERTAEFATVNATDRSAIGSPFKPTEFCADNAAKFTAISATDIATQQSPDNSTIIAAE